MIIKEGFESEWMNDVTGNFPLDATYNPGDVEFAIVNLLASNFDKTQVWLAPNSFSLTLVLNTAGLYSNRANTFNAIQGTVIFIRPYTCRQIELQDVNQIWHITFSEVFLMKYAGVDLFVTFPSLAAEDHAPKKPCFEIVEDLLLTILQIERENHSKSQFRKNSIANLIIRLLLKIAPNFRDG